MRTQMIGIMIVVSALTASIASGQKGMGEEIGLARQGAQPEIVTLQGNLERIETGPCRHTVGRAYIGTHLFLRMDDGKLINLHIGSAEAVASFVDTLDEGQRLDVDAFRTDRHEENHYVAKILRTDEREWTVRNEDLSPFWAGQRQQRRGQPEWYRHRGADQDRGRERRREERQERREMRIRQ